MTAFPARLLTAFALATVGMTGFAPVASAAAPACSGLVSDFNGDGYADAVVSDIAGSAGAVLNAGRVVILYGTSSGPGTGPVATLTQSSVGGTPQPGDGFGTAPAVADLNGDDCADLVVGSPGEEVGGFLGAGVIHVVYGAPGGLNTGDPAATFDAPFFGRAADPDGGFGSQIAVAPATDVSQALVAIGAPGGRAGGKEHAGWVVVFAADSDSWKVYDQNTKGIPGSAETGDAFGRALAFGYFKGTTNRPDLVVGAPNEDTDGKTDNGTITVIPDPLNGGGAATYYSQNSPGVPGTAESGDTFGYSLAAVHAQGTSWLAVGVPGEGIGSKKLAGAVQLFTSDLQTLKAAANFHQDTPGISGAAEANDFFGETLAFGFGATVRDVWLAVGTPHETGAAQSSGLVQLFPMRGRLTAERTYSQSTAGVPGKAEALDYFGSAIGFAGTDSQTVLLAGVGDDHEFGAGMVDVIPLAKGSAPTVWRPGRGGVPSSGFSAFGSALAAPARF